MCLKDKRGCDCRKPASLSAEGRLGSFGYGVHVFSLSIVVETMRTPDRRVESDSVACVEGTTVMVLEEKLQEATTKIDEGRKRLGGADLVPGGSLKTTRAAEANGSNVEHLVELGCCMFLSVSQR